MRTFPIGPVLAESFAFLWRERIAIQRATVVPATIVVLVGMLLPEFRGALSPLNTPAAVVVFFIKAVVMSGAATPLHQLVLAGPESKIAHPYDAMRCSAAFIVQAGLIALFLLALVYWQAAAFSHAYFVLPDSPGTTGEQWYFVSVLVGALFGWPYTIAMIAFGGALVWASARLLPLGPMTVAAGTVAFRSTWNATRGYGFVLFLLGAIAILTVLPFYALDLFGMQDSDRGSPQAGPILRTLVRVIWHFAVAAVLTAYAVALQGYAYKAMLGRDLRAPLEPA